MCSARCYQTSLLFCHVAIELVRQSTCLLPDLLTVACWNVGSCGWNRLRTQTAHIRLKISVFHMLTYYLQDSKKCRTIRNHHLVPITGRWPLWSQVVYTLQREPWVAVKSKLILSSPVDHKVNSKKVDKSVINLLIESYECLHIWLIAGEAASC